MMRMRRYTLKIDSAITTSCIAQLLPSSTKKPHDRKAVLRGFMAEIELSLPTVASSHDVSSAKATTDEEKRRRRVVVLLRIILAAGRSTRTSPETSECDPENQQDESGYEDEVYDWECEYQERGSWKRDSRPLRSTSSHKKPKTNPRKLPRPSEERRERKTRENVRSNAEACKGNNEKRLRKMNIERLGLELYFKRTQEVYSGMRGRAPSKMSAPRGYIPHKQRRRNNEGRTTGDHPAALLYELKNEDTSDELSRLLVELQHRDLTPEDYETLLRLDEQVTPKTVPESALASFETLTLQSSSNLVGELCSICMEVYSVAQSVKTLPCHHTFHCSCIDTWLSSASLNCPLDGIAVPS